MSAGLKGQTVTVNVTGKVSFLSSQNIYVKFGSTAGISAGDTLFISSGGRLIPVLKVNNLSSVSCVCTAISDIDLPVDHLIVARIKPENPKPAEKVTENIIKEIPQPEIQSDTSKPRTVTREQKQHINGYISVNSYSDFSNTAGGNSQRFRYTFSLDAHNIANSKVSLETYISFRHKSGDWAEVKSNLFNALKIYDLALRYDLNKTNRIFLGRKINPRISSIGAIDGLQYERSFKDVTLGVVAGTRPDYTDYGLDLNLFQYGGFLSVNTSSSGAGTESSLAFMQQMNKSRTDRRFLYFQHSNSLIRNIYFMSSFEIDLYKLTNDQPKSTFDLTGAYISLRYNLSKSFTLTGSYDARKNVIFYETYKTFTDRILENEIRQGYRVSANWRLAKNMMFGLQSGYRFLKSDHHPAKNIYGYYTYSRIPGLNMSATLSVTFMESAYMNGKIAGLNLFRDFSGGKLQTGIGYHYVDYRLPENKLDIIQHTGEVNFYWQVAEKMNLSVNFEVTSEQKNTYNRVYLQIRKRF